MWYLEKEVTISSAHHLRDYVGKCTNQHGHNWKITVSCRGDQLDSVGMLIDFVTIKEKIMKYDHKDLNDFPQFQQLNPTAENLAKVLYEEIPYCCEVLVEECDGSRVFYTGE